MKKIIGIIIVCLLLISVICLFADFNRYTYKTKTVCDENEEIIFSITTFDGKGESEPFIMCLGHAWVSIDNKTGRTIKLMDYEIEDGETVTLSAWALSEHRGVYFNLEPNFIKQFGRYVGRKSLSVGIDESQLAKIEDYIRNNDNWTFVKNCSHWSLDLWNEVVGDEYRLKTQTVIYTPGRLLKSFDEYDCVETDKDFSNAKEVFYYRNGVRTELELCS